MARKLSNEQINQLLRSGLRNQCRETVWPLQATLRGRKIEMMDVAGAIELRGYKPGRWVNEQFANTAAGSYTLEPVAPSEKGPNRHLLMGIRTIEDAKVFLFLLESGMQMAAAASTVDRTDPMSGREPGLAPKPEKHVG